MVAHRGHIKSKRLTALVNSIPAALPSMRRDSKPITVSQLVERAGGSSGEGTGSGDLDALNAKVVSLVPSDQSVPQAALLVDSEGTFVVLTVYDIAPNVLKASCDVCIIGTCSVVAAPSVVCRGVPPWSNRSNG